MTSEKYKIKNENARTANRSSSLCTSIIENFNYLANEQHINLSFKAPEYPVILWADTDKLEKIIFNLISNAFKYTPKGKNITIEITENEKSYL